MIECTLTNIHTYNEITYFFEVLPRVGELIVIDGYDIRNNEDWQNLVGADESDPFFENMGIRTFQVCGVHHCIGLYNRTTISIFIDEFYGKEIDDKF